MDHSFEHLTLKNSFVDFLRHHETSTFIDDKISRIVC